LGPIVPIPESRQCGQPGLAWFQVQNESTWFSEAASSAFPHHHLAFIMTDKNLPRLHQTDDGIDMMFSHKNDDMRCNYRAWICLLSCMFCIMFMACP
jgi:hypothetical protein